MKKKEILKLFFLIILLFVSILPIKGFAESKSNSTSDKPEGDFVLPDGEGYINITKDNFLDYFQLNGSATYDQGTGILTLTPNQGNKAGIATFKKKILFDKDIEINVGVNIGDKAQNLYNGGADGVGFSFHSDSVSSIGTIGNGFAIGGLSSAVGFKIDTFFNAYDELSSVKAFKDPSQFSGNGHGKGTTFAGFIATDENKNVYTIDDQNNYGFGSIPWQVAAPSQNTFRDLRFSYNSASKVLSSYYDDSQLFLPLDTFYGYPAKMPAKSFSMSGSTAGGKNLQQVQIKSIKVSVPIAVIEKVDENDSTKRLPGAIFNIISRAQGLKNVAQVTTDENGFAYLPSNLEDGNYYAQEIKTPEGYIFGNSFSPLIPITIDSNTGHSYIAATVKNKKNHGKMETSKESDKSTVRVGDIINYKIAINNAGSKGTILTDVKTEDNLPDGLELVKDSVKLNGRSTKNMSNLSNGVSVVVSKVLGGEKAELTFEAKVTKKLGSNIKNIATVIDPDDSTNPQTPESNVEVLGPPMTIKKTVHNSTITDGLNRINEPLYIGDLLDYEINLINSTGGELTNLKLDDRLPNKELYRKLGKYQLLINGKTVEVPENLYDESTNQLSASIKNVPIDATVILKYQLQTTGISQNKKLINKASASADGIDEVVSDVTTNSVQKIPVLNPENPIESIQPIKGTVGEQLSNLNLVYVPSFDFGEQKIVNKDIEYNAAPLRTIDGKEHPNYVQLHDTLQDSSGWRLSMSLTDFYNTKNDKLLNAQLIFKNTQFNSFNMLKDNFEGNLPAKVVIDAGGDTNILADFTGKNDSHNTIIAFGNTSEKNYVNSVLLKVPGTSKKTVDQYQASLDWQLQDVPK